MVVMMLKLKADYVGKVETIRVRQKERKKERKKERRKERKKERK
jgi:hypothetical protein